MLVPTARGLCAIAAAVAWLAMAACEKERTALPALGAELGATSVSGLSAGAYMAGQFQIAHSSVVIGAGIIAGGPYGCAESVFSDLMPGPGTAFLNLSKAMNGCMLDALLRWGTPDAAQLAERARQLARDGRIDAVAGLARNRVYLFTGTKDHTVLPTIVTVAAEVYAQLGVPAAQIKLVTHLPAGHALVTEDKGLDCGQTGEPYITHCGYDQAGALLAHILGPLQPRAGEPTGEIIVFDQREFVRDLSDPNLSDSGMVYVPTPCRPASDRTAPACRVHIIFHGCNQHRAKVGDVLLKSGGFTEWADTNRIILLFPQVSPSTINPQACWDWWGYTGRAYLTREGAQIVAVRRMLDRLTAEPSR
jgi:poly(3-hydroxybutyrate) depolymerase